MNWHTPPFDTLPPLEGSDCRWVGTSVMDEEEYRVEGWHCAEVASTTYWRAVLSGLVEYPRLRRERRESRRAQWQAREEANDEWSRVIEAQVERLP